MSPRGFGRGDFQWEDTRLYITHAGRWFLVGKGGPSSRWARPSGQNGMTGGSGIKPIDEGEARELLERHGTVDDVERFFPVEDA